MHFKKKIKIKFIRVLRPHPVFKKNVFERKIFFFLLSFTPPPPPGNFVQSPWLTKVEDDRKMKIFQEHRNFLPLKIIFFPIKSKLIVFYRNKNEMERSTNTEASD